MSQAQGFKWKKWLLILIILGVIGGGGMLFYGQQAFPESRCEYVEHLKSPDTASDCYACHIKATPKIAQDWYESKHGVMLVKCFVCHGEPDGKGAVTYAKNPDVETVCKKCHDPAIQRMEDKFGLELNCNQCHPYHQNSIHHSAYTKSISKTKVQ